MLSSNTLVMCSRVLWSSCMWKFLTIDCHGLVSCPEHATSLEVMSGPGKIGVEDGATDDGYGTEKFAWLLFLEGITDTRSGWRRIIGGRDEVCR